MARFAPDGQTVESTMLLRRGNIPAQPDTCELDDFEVIGKPLGSGSFAFVNKVAQKGTGKFFAMKVISKTKILELNLLDNIEREISTQQTVQHPNILRLYKCFEDQQDVHLLLEFGPNGTLFDLLKAHRKRALDEASRGLPEPRAAGVFRDVAEALSHLHGLGIVHRDLKPENLLVCEGGVVKLADFGWCNRCAQECEGRSTFCGTWEYIPPEMLASEPYDCKVDVWAAGVLLFEMLAGFSPFATSNYVLALAKITNAAYECPGHISLPACDLVGKLLVKEPSERLGLAEASEHPWVQAHIGYEREDTVQHSCSDLSIQGKRSTVSTRRPSWVEAEGNSGGDASPLGSSFSCGSPPGSSRLSSCARLSSARLSSTKSDRGQELEMAHSKQGAQALLARALRARSVTLLESAVKKAEAAGLEGQELAEARQALAEESRRLQARRNLMRATQRRCEADIRRALAEVEGQISKDSELVDHARSVLAILAGEAPDNSDCEGLQVSEVLRTKSAPVIRAKPAPGSETEEDAVGQAPIARFASEPDLSMAAERKAQAELLSAPLSMQLLPSAGDFLHACLCSLVPSWMLNVLSFYRL